MKVKNQVFKFLYFQHILLCDVNKIFSEDQSCKDNSRCILLVFVRKYLSRRQLLKRRVDLDSLQKICTFSNALYNTAAACL